MSFVLGAALLVAVYYLCGKGSQLVGAHLGLVSVAHATVLGTAAYAYALFGAMTHSPWAAAAVALLLAGSTGTALVGLSHRIRGNEYSLFTFAWQLIWFAAASNWRAVTGGALGLSDVRPIVVFEGDLSLVVYVVAALVLAVAVFLLLRYAQRRPYLRACTIIVRSDELAATIGLPAARMRLEVGFFYGAVLGLAGVLLANYISVVDPGQFATSTSMTILAIGLFAGVRIRWLGPLTGAVLLVGVPEGLRFVALDLDSSSFFQMTLAGVAGAVITFLLFRRDG